MHSVKLLEWRASRGSQRRTSPWCNRSVYNRLGVTLPISCVQHILLIDDIYLLVWFGNFSTQNTRNFWTSRVCPPGDPPRGQATSFLLWNACMRWLVHSKNPRFILRPQSIMLWNRGSKRLIRSNLVPLKPSLAQFQTCTSTVQNVHSNLTDAQNHIVRVILVKYNFVTTVCWFQNALTIFDLLEVGCRVLKMSRACMVSAVSPYYLETLSSGTRLVTIPRTSSFSRAWSYSSL